MAEACTAKKGLLTFNRRQTDETIFVQQDALQTGNSDF
jgi:hypothetical protein